MYKDGSKESILIEAASGYALATSVPCFAVDPEGKAFEARKTSFPAGPFSPACGACFALAGKEGPAEPRCADVYRYGMYQAERFGGSYIYFCPKSFLHWVSPVSPDLMRAGALVGGPVLIMDREEFLAEEFSLAESDSRTKINLIREALDSVPVVSPARAGALAEQLSVLARHLERMMAGERDPRAETSSRQAKIGEYIQELKKRFPKGQSHRFYPFAKENELLDLTAAGDRAGASRVLNEILGAIFFASGGDLKKIRLRSQELVVLLSRAAVKGGASTEEAFGENASFVERVGRVGDVEELAERLSSILNRFMDSVFTLKGVKHADAIKKAERFIRERYMEDIQLADVAKAVGFSPAYFSKVFKEETGSGFAAWLSKLRVEKSKTLLKDKALPLAEVAGLCGFDDQSYFCRVFKSIVGTSPGRFREGRTSGEAGIEIHDSAPWGRKR